MFITTLIITLYFIQVIFILLEHSINIDMASKWPNMKKYVWNRKQLLMRMIPFVYPFIAVFKFIMKIYRETPKS